MTTADEIADLARNLGGPTANEVRIRCGISRAYYAAFHYCEMAANNFCEQLPESDKKDRGNHSQLYVRLENHSKSRANELNLKKMAAEAQNLKNLRVDADYHLNKILDLKLHGRSLHYMNQVKYYLNELK